MNNLTEMYSAIKADVPNDDPLTQVNEELLDELRQVKQVNSLIYCYRRPFIFKYCNIANHMWSSSFSLCQLYYTRYCRRLGKPWFRFR